MSVSVGQIDNAEKVYKQMADAGVVTRYRCPIAESRAFLIHTCVRCTQCDAASDISLWPVCRGNCVHCDGCIRVTIGTVAENDQFLELLKATCAELNK